MKDKAPSPGPDRAPNEQSADAAALGGNPYLTPAMAQSAELLASGGFGGADDAQPGADLPSGGGEPLDPAIGGRVEAATGEALPDVRVHDGAASAGAAAAMGARAFTTGSDIHLGAGASKGDQRLMAHEAAHTIHQRGGGGAPQAKAEVSTPGDALEREADAVADAVESGGSASVSAGAAGGVIQRDVVSEVEELLSYGALDWAITDAEAREALGKLASLDTEALSAALARLGQDFKTRLLDNLPASAKRGASFTKVLVAMGPTAVRPYVEDLLSYGVFDWAVTDGDAAEVLRLFSALSPAQKVTLWTALSASFRGRLADNLQHGDAGGTGQATLKALFDATPDAEVQTLCDLMRARFRVTFQATGDSDETPLDWEAGGLRRMWAVLEALPAAHVEGNSALDFVERYQHDAGDSAGGYYWSGRDNVAMSYDPAKLGSQNTAAQQNVTRADGSSVDDPLYGVNRFDKVARHEVGHAVDDANGHADSYCVGNAGGGNWAQLTTSAVATTLVTASGGAISGWADATQKQAIIDCLQGVIDDRKPGEIDDRIDAIAGLEDTEKASVKGDNAVAVLKGCFAMRGHNPWYKYPSTGGTALGGRIYQEAYSGDWWSYDQSSRSRKVSTYQFRAPGEWFAEAYAAYYEPSANKGDKLATVDPASKTWFDQNVDPDGGRPNGMGPPPDTSGMGDFPTPSSGDGTAVV